MRMAGTPLVEGDWKSVTEIRDSTVRVKLEVSSTQEGLDSREQWYKLKRGAQFIAEGWLSVLSFAEGAHYSTQIQRIEDSTGYIREFGPRLRFGPEAADLRIANAGHVAGLVAAMSLRIHEFEVAVRNYAKALCWSQDAPFFCYRALEALCGTFGKDWENMHRSLGTNRCAIYTLIQQHADPTRHAEEPSYEELDRSPWYALTYVRDTLLAFLIKNSPTATYLAMPKLGHCRIPDHIDTVHKGNCPHRKSQERERMVVEFPAALHRDFRVAAAKNGDKIPAAVLKAVRSYVDAAGV